MGVVKNSVRDDPHVFRPAGSGSGSPDPLVRGADLEPAPDPSLF